MVQATWLRNLPAVPAVRLATGLAQGVALCLLYSAAENGYWPATHGLVFAPLLLVACFVPVIVLNGAGNMRPRSLLVWAGAAALLLTGLAVHDIARGAEGSNVWGVFTANRGNPAIAATRRSGRHRCSLPSVSWACSLPTR
jgi:peptidoglycan/LPS O-acetylase OafA/YrhL